MRIITYWSLSSTTHTFTIVLLSGTLIWCDCHVHVVTRAPWKIYNVKPEYLTTLMQKFIKFKQNKQVFYTVNVSPWVRVIITTAHVIHQNVLQIISFDKKFPCCCTKVSPLLAVTFTSKRFIYIVYCLTSLRDIVNPCWNNLLAQCLTVWR